jgi:hypothetical protein
LTWAVSSTKRKRTKKNLNDFDGGGNILEEYLSIIHCIFLSKQKSLTTKHPKTWSENQKGEASPNSIFRWGIIK